MTLDFHHGFRTGKNFFYNTSNFDVCFHANRAIDLSDALAIFINIADERRGDSLAMVSTVRPIMNVNGQTLKPLKLHARENWLWLWILPTALSWLLVSLIKPTGGAVLWVELAVICSCSCLCSFALAIKSFSTFKERLWGWLFFTGGSLCVIASVVFIGCFLPSRPSADDIRKGAIRGERDNKAWVARQIVRRDDQTDPTMLDLTSYYDALLPGQFNHSNPSGFRAGTHTWEGIKFDVRGMVLAKRQPDGQISGIPVRQKCSGIAFLHGAYRGYKRNHAYSRCVIRFTNGHTETIPLAFGKDVTVSELSAIPPGFNWMMQNASSWPARIPPNGESRPNFVFCIKQWSNPSPEEGVASIDIVPSSDNAEPLLVAITVRPVNH